MAVLGSNTRLVLTDKNTYLVIKFMDEGKPLIHIHRITNKRNYYCWKLNPGPRWSNLWKLVSSNQVSEEDMTEIIKELEEL